MRVVIAVLSVIAAGATALVIARADARPTAGSASAGCTITIAVAPNAARLVQAHIRCPAPRAARAPR